MSVSVLSSLGLFLLVLAAGCQSNSPQVFESQPGNFRATFPGQPKTSKKQIDTESGPLTLHTTDREQKDGTYRSVTYFELPKKNLRQQDARTFIENTAKGACAKWDVSSNRPIELADHQGREIRASVPVPGASENFLGHYRVYLAGNRVYQLIILGPSSTSDPKAFDTFLDSFALIHDVQEIAGTAPEPETPATKAEPEPEGSRP